MPQPDRAQVVVVPPGEGSGYWAGAPSAVRSGDHIYLAYRLRRPVRDGRGYAIVIARSADGAELETIDVLEKDHIGVESLERPGLVQLPDGGWRLYVSGATPGTLHWWVDAIDVPDPSGFSSSGRRRPTLPGDAVTAVKDPVVSWDGGQWHLWVCCHPLPDPAEADRMVTRYATSRDGVEWDWHGVALEGRSGRWDQRGADHQRPPPQHGLVRGPRRAGQCGRTGPSARAWPWATGRATSTPTARSRSAPGRTARVRSAT